MTRKRISTSSAPIDIGNLVKATIECLSNAKRLLEQAELLSSEYEGSSTAYALAVLAQEETVKAFLLFLVSYEGLPWNPLVHRSLRDHTCKQLWFVVLEAFVADIDEHLSQADPVVATEFDASGRLLEKVADVLNWYRYAKLETWDQGYCDWDEEPADGRVKEISAGKLDRKKQNALYVGIGSSGKVTSTPESFTDADARQAIDVAERYHSHVSDLIGIHGGHGWRQVEWIRGLLKAIFTPPVRTGRVNRDLIPGVEIYEESRVVLQSPKVRNAKGSG